MSENILRDKMELRLKSDLRYLALQTRSNMGVTQRIMSERYVMAESSYSALESGDYMCGTLTTVLLLADQPDPKATLEEIVNRLEKLRKDEMISLW